MANSEKHGMMSLSGLSRYCSGNYHGDRREDRFGRMFGDLPPAYVEQSRLSAAGLPGGPMDSGAQKHKTSSVPVGMVFFGQFVDHDITLDATTSFRQVVQDAGAIPNVRTPTLDLDCIYGLGPEAEPFLYTDAADDFRGVKLLTGADSGAGGLADSDLARAANGRAIIGDPRNDENRIVSQIQLAMIRFHNHVAETLHSEEPGLRRAALYEEARRITSWHYQHAVVFDFLKAMCGGAVVEDILGCGRKFYCGGIPYIPVEFSVAAYRFGHSMIPQKIQVQKNGAKHDLFGAILGSGFKPLASADGVVDFHELFETSANRSVERTDRLDTKLVSILLDLPFVASTDPNERSLAVRNLMRGNAFLLPGGEKVAGHIGRSQAEIDKVQDKIEDLGLSRKGIPLWLYILAEAEEIGRESANGGFDKGEGLGPVGARIVAETIIGLLELDDHSFLGANRNFVPRDEWNDIGKILTVAQP